jgi:Pentapeptide repeats (8 copies)
LNHRRLDLNQQGDSTMPIDIWTSCKDKPLLTVEAETLVGIDLHGRDLRNCDFQRAQLGAANLSACDLRGCLFMHASLENADLRGALLTENFYRANLRGTLLDGCVIPWHCRDLISELLRRAAHTPERMAYATRGVSLAVGVQPADGRCWDGLYAERHPEMGWAIGVLAAYVRDGDNAPEFLKRAAEALENFKQRT